MNHHGVTHVEYGAVCAVSVKTGELETHFTKLAELLTSFFPRRDLRSNAMDYVRGLLTPGVAGNCWAVAETAGHARPFFRLQHLLSGAVWDEDAIVAVYAAFDADHAFATKGRIARARAHRALDAGLGPARATGDEVYGRSSELRTLFRQRGLGYVFAVDADFRITTPGSVTMRADQAIGLVEPRDTTC